MVSAGFNLAILLIPVALALLVGIVLGVLETRRSARPAAPAVPEASEEPRPIRKAA